MSNYNYPPQSYIPPENPQYQYQQGNYPEKWGNAEYAPQQGYGQQQNAPAPVNFDSKPQGQGPTFTERFKIQKPRINDPIFAILFLAVLGGFIAVSAIALSAYTGNASFQGTSIYSSSNSFSLNANTMILMAFVCVVAVVLAFLYYTMARMFTRQFIIVTIILNIALALGTAIFYLVEKYYSAGVVFLVFALFSAFCYWTMRHRIPFATLVLKTIIDVTRQHPSTLMISALGALVAGAFSMYFSASLVALYAKYDPNSDNPQCAEGGCSQGKLVGLIVYMVFAAYYISEVIKNVIHVSISGVYGSWYYCSKSDQGMPKWPAWGAFKRAMTYSFGSICFGSLIVAIINFIREILNAAQHVNQDNGGNIAVTIVLCFAQCCVGILDWAVTYFNHYAYTFIALYGKAYLPSAKDTWQLVKHKGIDALVNDSLIGNVLTFGATFVGYVSALLAYLYLKFTKPEYNSDGGFYPIVIAFAFLIGTQVGHITTVSIRSGTATFFVALAKDPDVLRMSYPEIYEGILQTYPGVREKLNI
uniref:Protein PNS1 n=1 Tax=Blastobotrys adeninivorans TaxID=409370 RepID=A0A060T496_BLAAD